MQVGRRIGAALNVGITDPQLFWLTAVAQDGTIVVANNYGLGYIPDGVNLPEQVKMASADESIPPVERGKWATYPILALHGWAQHHGVPLRAVIATEEQFKGFDAGVSPIVLQPDDIPTSGHMQGRGRLEVIAPDAAATLAQVSDAGLTAQLPAAPTDATPPEDRRTQLWLEVFRPLLNSDPGRSEAQLQAMVNYAAHAEELALHRAHTATDAVAQRAAIADWIYWQHVGVLSAEALGIGS